MMYSCHRQVLDYILCCAGVMLNVGLVVLAMEVIHDDTVIGVVEICADWLEPKVNVGLGFTIIVICGDVYELSFSFK